MRKAIFTVALIGGLAAMAATAQAQPVYYVWNGGCPYVAGWVPGDGVINDNGFGWKVRPTYYVRTRYYLFGNFC